MCKYKSCWNVSNINPTDAKNSRYRFSLEIKKANWKRDSDVPLYVLLMNPSKADMTQSDRTVNMTLAYADDYGYNRVITLNVLPSYGTKQKSIKNCKSVENIECIKKNIYMAFNDELNITLLIATGNLKYKIFKDSYNRIIKFFESYFIILKVLQPNTLTNSYARHPSRIGKNVSLVDACISQGKLKVKSY